MNNDFNNYQKQQYYQQQNAQFMIMKRQIEFAKKEQRKEIIKARKGGTECGGDTLD